VVSSVTEPSHAVFLSYASQDAEAAQRICEALRAAGIEVWFDQSELRGGDAWDRQIRKQIHDCALFVPVISAHSDARQEGYFRREWRLAVERTGDMAEDVAFLVPVVIDTTPDATARVPDRFRDVQWTRLPDGQASPAFIERVLRLLSPPPDQVATAHATTPSVPDATLRARRAVPGPSWSKPVLGVIVAIAVFAALAYFVPDKFLISKHPASPPASSTGFAPPPHSIAVLPFVNLSGDASQDYFSDGLTEELLNSLAEIEGLQVAARTSSFSFKEHPDIATVAHKLNVSAVLEGSVRRSEHTVRVTAQLINAVTGFHLWSKTYDRDLGDVLKLQTEIATAVASTLKITLLGDVAGKIESGGTHNPAAFDAYLRAAKVYNGFHDAKDLQTAIAAYTEAIGLDANYALAFAGRSLALSRYASEFATDADVRKNYDRAQADARQALSFAPDLAEGHLALAEFFSEASLDMTQALAEYERAIALAPGNARVLSGYARQAVSLGRVDAGIAAGRRAVVLDPLNAVTHRRLGISLFFAHRYQEAIGALSDGLALDPDDGSASGSRGVAYYMLGDFEKARSSCESKQYWVAQWCLVLAYSKLGRHPDAEAVLAKLKAAYGDAQAYQYATIYAQWGDTHKAVEWLETALRLRDSGLGDLKSDPLLDPLRKEPRFQAVEKALKFPD
jgi:TolB-like protein/tetratricopeptide (TPR) repeat protein